MRLKPIVNASSDARLRPSFANGFVIFSGAIGVILSLLYLATQIRAQNRESKLAAYRDMSASFNVFLGDMANSSELASIYLRGMNGFDSLDEVERLRCSSHFNRVCRVFESLYLQYLNGSLEQSSWEGMNNILIDSLTSPGFRQWWQIRRHWYSNAYCKYVDELLAKDA